MSISLILLLSQLEQVLLLADWQVLGELEVLVEHPAFLFVGMLVLVARVAAILGLLGQALFVAVA